MNIPILCSSSTLSSCRYSISLASINGFLSSSKFASDSKLNLSEPLESGHICRPPYSSLRVVSRTTPGIPGSDGLIIVILVASTKSLFNSFNGVRWLSELSSMPPSCGDLNSNTLVPSSAILLCFKHSFKKVSSFLKCTEVSM
ncbi:unnamed protein product [Moneuplotes crassus]|uniref:Uncharacterized protein n=1 Tax=Euplotes crassus TaxID=5936 RepID=A0AAD1XEU4_EUPCR|nr:unnamed protein product [Moneuplotes crassus]